MVMLESTLNMSLMTTLVARKFSFGIKAGDELDRWVSTIVTK